MAATATSPSSAGIYIDNVATSALTAVGVSTYDGSVTILSAGGELSFQNSVLSETGAAVVTFANTDDAGRLGRQRRCKRHSPREQHRGRYQCQWHCRRGTNPDELDDQV